MNTGGLSHICNGIGYRKEDVDGALIGYVKNDYCLDNLKDLQRFLRRDDPVGRAVFKQICKWNVVSRDLVPLLENYQEERNLIINTVKVLVFLTMPVDPTSDDIPQQIEHLWQLKAALTRNVTTAVIVSLLEEPLEHLDCGAFTEDDWKLVQLVLTFFRNVLAIQDFLLHQKASGLSTQFLHFRESFLEILFNENVMELILALTQYLDDVSGYLCSDNLLILEIFYYIFHGQKPELVATITNRKSQVNEVVSTTIDSLNCIMEEENETRRNTKLKTSDLQSIFSGTFSQHAIDGSMKLVIGNPKNPSDSVLLKSHKIQRGPLKKIAWDNGSLLSPKKDIMELLYNFLNNLLSGAYNVLMQSIREDIVKEHHAVQNSDIITFFQTVCFVTSFQRHLILSSTSEKTDVKAPENSHVYRDRRGFIVGDICGPIAATMNESMIFLVISKWRNAFDTLKECQDYKCLSSSGSRRETMRWGRLVGGLNTEVFVCRRSVAPLAEIRMLDLVLTMSPEGSTEHKTARILVYKISYDQTDEGFSRFLLNQIRSFDAHKQPKSDLIDLVEILHVLLRLMEDLEEHGSIRVARKSRKRVRKRTQLSDNKCEAKKLTDEIFHQSDTQNPVLENGKSFSELAEDLNVPVTENASISERTDEQADIQDIIDGGLKNEENHSTLHLDKRSNNFSLTAKENALHSQQESDINTSIFFHVGTTLPNGLIDQEHINGYSSDEEQQPLTKEVDLNTLKLVSEFASCAAIHNICWLLKFCKHNSSSTNYYIMCMLQRICDDLELCPILYQLSFLTIFHEILADKKASLKCPDVVNFLSKLVRNMMKLMKRQPLLFVEILFRKTRKECHMINADGIAHDISIMKRKICELDDERNTCFSNGLEKLSGKSLKDALGEDEADVHDFIPPRTQASNFLGEDMQCQLDKANIISGKRDDEVSMLDHISDQGQASDKGVNMAPRRKKKYVFYSEQEDTIKSLYEKHKHDKQCNRIIANTLDPLGKLSPLQVSCKIRQLGLKGNARKKKNYDSSSFSKAESQVELDHDLSRVATLQSDEAKTISHVNSSLKPNKKRTLRKEFGTSSSKPMPSETELEDGSDDQLLALMLKKRNKKKKTRCENVDISKSKPNPTENVLYEEESDDQRPLSLMVKENNQRLLSRNNLSNGEKDLPEVATHIIPSGNYEACVEGDSLYQSLQLVSSLTEDNVTSLCEKSLLNDDLNCGKRDEQKVISLISHNDQSVSKELVDFVDDLDATISSGKIRNGRRLMIIDDEDDE